VTAALEFAEIVLLDCSVHNRAAFSCGSETYDRYLQQMANQDAKKHLAACWVLTLEGSVDIIGYYTLSACALTLPAEEQKKITRYAQIPATLIGRLAASNKTEHKGHHIGERLLMNALARSLEYSSKIGSRVVVVDSEEEAIGFYEKYNFVRLQDPASRLILEMDQIKSILG
jgi:predicted GNAT family N-acyltransferase